MPRFFFHIEDGAFLPDTEGTELAGVAEAREAAVTASGETIRDAGISFWTDNEPWRMHVTDAAGLLLFTLRFSSEIPTAEVTFRPIAPLAV